MEASQVVLAGQDLVFFENRSHATGLQTQRTLRKTAPSLGCNDGVSRPSSPEFIRFKESLEKQLSRSAAPCYTLSEKGAKLQGVSFISPKDLQKSCSHGAQVAEFRKKLGQIQ
ncbi:hypothetical protein [Chitinivibrio alkaliphilus]|uniref:Uncharacterized protein n=1 Tax=Chitinivibrio alkaliphilus ACht1 TaxID=1313304 RepID=U7D9U5_9BACT|nr:hypothetical protein [Chitinivibrio alkaliphilus]ERP31857.1 hypothetical protein CALK_1308 [Chitinivibrio alkaliphilus ACht1]